MNAGRTVVRASIGSRVGIVAGVVGLAITQPLLDLMGRNPEFFIAGRYTSIQIIEFGLVVALVPTAALSAVVLLSGRLHRRVGDAVYVGLLVALGALLGNVIARGVRLDGVRIALLAGVVGAALVVGLTRARAGRMLLQYLAAANAFFLFGFLVISPTSALVGGSGPVTLGDLTLPVPPGPVVVVVFDELPLSTLMSRDGTINEQRYPSFARLAAGSTWYRNASSLHQRTERAVPQLLSGLRAEPDTLPSYVDLPRNLFTMVAGAIPVQRYEAITDMCPPSLCATREGQPVNQALHDAMVVLGHRVLPPGLRAHLPAIDNSWGGFGEVTAGGESASPGNAKPSDAASTAVFKDGRLARWFSRSEDERSAPNQVAILEEQAALIDTTPALHLVHVVLPHAPWVLTPWGTKAMETPPTISDPADPAYDWFGRLAYQRHALQVGAADVALGTVLDRLEAIGAWEDATVVVVADHGTSTLAPDFGRNTITEKNIQEVLRVPMFIKAAGQTAPAVVDEPALSIDLLPTLADLLHVSSSWHFDGHSLVAGGAPTRDVLVGESIDPLFDLAARHADQFPYGEDWAALAAVGEHGGLVGRTLAEMDIGEPSAMTWQPDHEDQFGSLPTADGGAPQLLTGSVTTPDGARPPEIVVAVNGTVGGTIGGFVPAEGGWRFASVLGPFLRTGSNDIQAFEVVGAVLRPLG